MFTLTVLVNNYHYQSIKNLLSMLNLLYILFNLFMNVFW